MDTDTRTSYLVAWLENIRHTSLDQIPVDQAAAINQAVHDRSSDEAPVSVARFGSVI